MVTLNQLILQEVNPFENWVTGNFWQETVDPAMTVESIHQEILIDIEARLDAVIKDHKTRSTLLLGDSGSGKSYLLSRLKQKLNPKAFFAYIEPFPDSNSVWRHTLRYTIDSLVQAPEGSENSQLLLWLKGLSAFKKGGLDSFLRSGKQKFVGNMRLAYPSGIFNAKLFFSALYGLTDEQLYPLACAWLKGDDLDEEDQKLLGVSKNIDSEDAAQKILGNFGRITSETQPIVLCFDQLDAVARNENGDLELPTIFSLNSVIHNLKLNNFLIILSMVTDNWKRYSKQIIASDKARIQTPVLQLKPLSLDQIEAVWKVRLSPLHQQADPKPESPIFPLDRTDLERNFPSGKAILRTGLAVAKHHYDEYRSSIPIQETGPVVPDPPPVPTPLPDLLSLRWQKELRQVRERVQQIKQFSSVELIAFLSEALTVLQSSPPEPRFLSHHKYAGQSLRLQNKGQRLGIVWAEEAHMSTFRAIMNACEQEIQKGSCDGLRVIRLAHLGKPNNQGHQIYRRIFSNGQHRHIKPDLDSVHQLATYRELVKDANAGELVLGAQEIDLSQLRQLVQVSDLLKECRLLRELDLFDQVLPPPPLPLQRAEEYLLQLVRMYNFLGKQTLVRNVLDRFGPDLEEAHVDQLIAKLCEAKYIRELDPNAKPEEQLICLIPDRS